MLDPQAATTAPSAPPAAPSSSMHLHYTWWPFWYNVAHSLLAILIL